MTSYQSTAPTPRCPSFLLHHKTLNTGALVSFAVDTNRQQVVTSTNKSLCVYSFSPWKKGLVEEEPMPADSSTTCLVFNPNHNIFYAARDGVHLVALSTLSLFGSRPFKVLSMEGRAHRRSILALAFSAPRELLVSSGVGGELIVWKTTRYFPGTLESLHHSKYLFEKKFTFQEADERWFTRLVFSRLDSHRPVELQVLLTIVDKDVMVWHFMSSTDEPVLFCHLRNLHDLSITDAIYDASTKRLITSGRDQCIKVWNFGADYLKPVELFSHWKPIRSMILDPHHQLLCSICEAGSLKLWSLSRGDEWDAVQVWTTTGLLSDCGIPGLGVPPGQALFGMELHPDFKEVASKQCIILMAGTSIVAFQLHTHSAFLTEATSDIMCLAGLMGRQQDPEPNPEPDRRRLFKSRGQRVTPGALGAMLGDTRAIKPAKDPTGENALELLVLTKDGTFQFLDPTFGHVNNVISPSVVTTNFDAEGDTQIRDADVTCMCAVPATFELYTGWTDGRVRVFHMNSGGHLRTLARRNELNDSPATCMAFLPRAGEEERMAVIPEKTVPSTPSASDPPHVEEDSRPGSGRGRTALTDSKPGKNSLKTSCLVVGHECGSILVFMVRNAHDPESGGSLQADASQQWHTSQPLLIKAHSARLLALLYLPQSQVLVSGSVNSSVKVWKVQDAKTVVLLSVFSTVGFTPLTCFIFTNDSEVISGHLDGTLGWWDLTKLTRTRVTKMRGATQKLQRTMTRKEPDPRVKDDWGQMTEMVEEHVYVEGKTRPGGSKDLLPQDKLLAHREKVMELCGSQCGDFFASCGLDGRVVVWDAYTKDTIHAFQFRYPVTHILPVSETFDLVVSVDRCLCTLAPFTPKERLQLELAQAGEAAPSQGAAPPVQHNSHRKLSVAGARSQQTTSTAWAHPNTVQHLQMDATGATHPIGRPGLTALNIPEPSVSPRLPRDSETCSSYSGTPRPPMSEREVDSARRSWGANNRSLRPHSALRPGRSTFSTRQFMTKDSPAMRDTNKASWDIKRLAGYSRYTEEEEEAMKREKENRTKTPPRQAKTARGVRGSNSSPTASGRSGRVSSPRGRTAVPKLPLDRVNSDLSVGCGGSSVSGASISERQVCLRGSETQADIMRRSLIIPADGKAFVKAYAVGDGNKMQIAPNSRTWRDVTRAISYKGSILTPPIPKISHKKNSTRIRRAKYRQASAQEWKVLLAHQEIPPLNSSQRTSWIKDD